MLLQLFAASRQLMSNEMKFALRQGPSSASSRICAKVPRLAEMAKRTFRQSSNICTCVDILLYELSKVVVGFINDLWKYIYLYCAVKK